MNDSTDRTSTRGRRSFLTVIDRMIALDLLKTLLSILLVLVTIIVSRKFLGILTKAIEGEVASETVFSLLGLKTLAAIAVLIPPSTFMAVLSVLGRMYRDHEMSVLASAGVGSKRIYQAMCWVIVPVFLFSLLMSLQIMPWSEMKSQELIKRDTQTHDIRGIKAGRFNEFSSGDIVLYAEEMDEEQNMRKIFVQNSKANSTSVVIANSGRLHRAENGDNFVILNNGRRYQGVPGTPTYTISEFDEYGVRISGPEEVSEALRREAMSTLALIISGKPWELAELQKRVGIPLSVLALAILAVPLARVSPRQGAYSSVFYAFVIYIVYENIQKITQGMLITGKIHAWTSYTLIYGLLFLMTIVLFLKNLGPRWIRHQWGRSKDA